MLIISSKKINATRLMYDTICYMNRFLNLEQQIEKLENQKGLVISNKEYAKKVLLSIGYFSIVTGYKFPFKDENNNYRKGTRLEDLVALFKFDENLRDLTLKYILKIQQQMQTLSAYCFCSKFGENQKLYLNPDAYVFKKDNKYQVYRLTKELDFIVNRSKDRRYIVEERKKGNVPLWVSINAFSMGALTKFYKFLPEDVKTKIARHFDGVSCNALENMLELVTDFRNVCAHAECLYNHKAYKKSVKVDKEDKSDFYALTTVFKTLLSSDDYLKFLKGLTNILESFSSQCQTLPKTELLSIMGFNSDYIPT